LEQTTEIILPAGCSVLGIERGSNAAIGGLIMVSEIFGLRKLMAPMIDIFCLRKLLFALLFAPALTADR
jgi:hypothetical protein